MDEEVRRFAWGHRRLRHDWHTAAGFYQLFRSEGREDQALLEVVLHIAADYCLISQQDLEIMKSLYPVKPSRKRKRGERG